jgi:hypothetical protein
VRRRYWAAATSASAATRAVIGIRERRVRLESRREVGPWFRWASAGADCAATPAAQVGLTVIGVRRIGGRVIATLVAL